LAGLSEEKGIVKNIYKGEIMVAGIPRKNVSTDKSEWCTPLNLYEKLDAEFHFDLDAACTPENCLNRNHYGYGKGEDALKQDWSKFMMDNGEDASVFFLNPPYGRGVIEAFVKKAFWESRDGATVVCLLPFSGAKWFRTYCLLADEIRIIGRVKYIGFAADGTLIRNSPTYDSCVVIFRPGIHSAKLTVFEW
jgi:phage N-6-adenine-methyltransferase